MRRLCICLVAVMVLAAGSDAQAAGCRLEHRDVVDAFNRYMAAATT